ncbi:hypothetical protein GCM10008995_17070 [Halobellus salinus]|uniref:Uncharacterized protein n=1 Tax=Halobellus salinus TaxID=931585 RepID=A0A830EAU1_9EURY|nr:hypothetical protein [Halobellus salinus]GGJ07742.1 hypothetical protein GCM10008995_17070 [Halobellus salinus]SMP26494.1 hypothetical protein SAMN06265347_11197 [Halobellus salinus]
MSTGTHPSLGGRTDSTLDDAPDVVVCETCPGRSVFVESANRDGWIATDLTVEPRR